MQIYARVGDRATLCEPYNHFMTPHQFFKDTFDLDFRLYADAFIYASLGVLTVDLFKFDEWLHEKFGDYEKAGDSMNTILIKHYGQEVADYIHKLATDFATKAS